MRFISGVTLSTQNHNNTSFLLQLRISFYLLKLKQLFFVKVLTLQLNKMKYPVKNVVYKTAQEYTGVTFIFITMRKNNVSGVYKNVDNNSWVVVESLCTNMFIINCQNQNVTAVHIAITKDMKSAFDLNALTSNLLFILTLLLFYYTHYYFIRQHKNSS